VATAVVLVALGCLGRYGWNCWQEERAFAAARKTAAEPLTPQASLRAWQEFLRHSPKGRRAEEARQSFEEAAKVVLSSFDLADLFEIPVAETDAQGNPVRKGVDEKTGYPLEIRHKVTGMHLVFIPPGTFEMGSPSGEKDRENNEEQHTVTLTRGFYLGKYEVTQSEWAAAMGNNPSRFKGDRNPVEMVSWDDCQEFLRKLNDLVGSARFSVSSEERAEARTTSLQFALPTEAQWEHACRAGTTTRFYWGDDESMARGYGNVSVDRSESKLVVLIMTPVRALFRLLGIHHEELAPGPLPVGGFRPNGFGVYDMTGNVWEWCQDWYGDYGTGRVTDPTGPTNGDWRVLRGGCWDYYPQVARSANRNGFRPDGRDSGAGFRVVVACVWLR
jgi:formylglycine-generating enzyme required for sulfatase activity